MTELDRARALLADAETALAAGINPYAAENVVTHRARVARLEATTGLAASAAPVVPPPAAKPAPEPLQPTGTRAERLRRLARAMDADDTTLAEALAADTAPDAFALEIMDSRDPDAVAARIMNSDKPVATKVATEVEETAQRILNA